jgi:hypothetical protein
MIGTLGRNRERIDVDYGFPQPAGRNEPDVTVARKALSSRRIAPA